jgi:hypothetical protein
MKRLNTSFITSGIGMPIKAGTLDFLQDAHKETAQDILTSVLGFSPDTNTVYILSGCVNSNTAPSYNVSAGVVYYNGEIFRVSAFTFTTTGTDQPYPNIAITQYSTNADIVQFTDGTTRNVHDIRSFVVTATSTSTGYPIYGNWLKAGAWIKGDTKEVVCNSTYLNTNFDSTGLGRLERKGWAIMNGSNGTQNDAGLTVIAYGTGYTTLEATGGSKNAVLIAHSHAFGIPQNTNSSGAGLFDQAAGGNANFTSNIKGQDENGANSTTETGVGKNMQPYVVRLRIQKI